MMTRQAVRQLLPQPQRQLLAHDLGGLELVRAVGQLVFGEVRRRLGQVAGDRRGQLFDVAALQRRQRHDLGEGRTPAQLLDERQQPLLREHFVGLVEHQDDRPALLHQLVEHALIFVGPAQRLDDEHVHVGVLQRSQRRAVHVTVHRAAGARVQAGRVDEDHLRGGSRQDAEDAVPRRLRLRADDADLAAEQRVQQRRLADVRPADDRCESTAVPCCRLLAHRWSPCNVCIKALRISCAAACSARRRLGPLATTRRPRASTEQRTWNI